MGERKEDERCSVNLLQFAPTLDMNLDGYFLNENLPTKEIDRKEVKPEPTRRSETIGNGVQRASTEKPEQQAVVNLPLSQDEQVKHDIDMKPCTSNSNDFGRQILKTQWLEQRSHPKLKTREP